MLKIVGFELSIIVILFISIFVTYNFDLGFYDYSFYFRDTLQATYLGKFFEDITKLGDSFWYLLISIACIIVFYVLKKSNTFYKLKHQFEIIQYYNLLLFLSIISSGILTQLIKHIVGRPRPNTLSFENGFSLKFFTFDSNFHSFPSGHTSTIFAVALVVSLLAPKLKYFFYLFAIIVSFSRVVVGAHFITDLIGGAAIAFIGFKISRLILSKIFNINKKKEPVFFINDSFKLVVFTFLLLSVLLAIGPTIDIFFSKLFQNENGGFALQGLDFKIEVLNYNRVINPTVMFRKLFLPIVLFYIFILPLFSRKLFFQQLYFGHIFKLKEVVFLWLSSVIGLIVLINLILKNFWGRSRPNEITDFEGINNFTPWYQITDQCISNCSFVSGDSSVGFALIVFYFLVKKKIYIWAALIFGFFLGLIRIMEGGHFISDITLAGLIIFAFYSLCYNFYIKKFNA